MHHGLNGQDSIPPLGLESQDYGWMWDLSAPESRLFNNMIVNLQLTQDARGGFARKSGPSIRNQVPGSIQQSSEAVRRSEGGEETEAAALRHQLSSDSAELSLLQKLKAKVCWLHAKLTRERRQFGAHPVCLFSLVLLSGWAFRATTQSRFSFSSWRFCYPCRLLWLSIKSASVQACVYSVRHCCFSQVFISSRCETLCLFIKHVTSTFSSRASWQTFFISFGYDGGELNNKACC